MFIENAVLESLIQDGRTIDLISSYLKNCCNIVINLEELKENIVEMYKKKLLKVSFPPQCVGALCLQDSLFAEYWFELSDDGEKECIKRNLMIETK